MKNYPILLTGITGSGKSTVGRNLAERMGRSFSDLDDIVLKKFGKTSETLDDLIQRIGGLDRFRPLEYDALLRQLVSSDGPQVVSLGGGAPTYNSTRLLMQKWALRVVRLSAPENVLWERILKDIIDGNNRANITREILHQRIVDRKPIYNGVSDFTEVNIGTTQACVDAILTKLQYGRICVSIIEWDTDSLRQAIDTINRSPEIRIVELRIDKIKTDEKEWDILKELNRIEKHILITNRTDREQPGGFSGTWEQGLENVKKLAHLAKYIDVELGLGDDVIINYKEEFPEVSLILSFHDFDGTPTLRELQDKVIQMMKYSDEQNIIPKIAVMPQSEADVQIIYQLTNWFKETYPNIDFIFISMGELGQETRINMPKNGGLLTFGALTPEGGSAPGQIYYPELYKRIYGDEGNKYDTHMA